jgi:hypothetical protein
VPPLPAEACCCCSILLALPLGVAGALVELLEHTLAVPVPVPVSAAEEPTPPVGSEWMSTGGGVASCEESRRVEAE